MAKTMNLMILLGHVAQDPVVRTATGEAQDSQVAQFTLTTSRRWKDRHGRRQEKVERHRCVAWNPPRGQQLADLVAQYVRAGDLVQVRGRLEYRDYQGRGDARPHAVAEVVVDDMILLSPKREDPPPLSAQPDPAADA